MEPNDSMMNHFDLSCKYCSFSCSGENIEMLCKHFEECRHILVTCSNEQCGYTAERHLMKDHSAICSSAIVNCPNIRCNDKINRMEMFSHMEKCLFLVKTSSIDVIRQWHTWILRNIWKLVRFISVLYVTNI